MRMMGFVNGEEGEKMREKEFDKLVDEVTARVSFRILSADWVCYRCRCGEHSILKRIEKLEQEAAKRARIAEPKTGSWESDRLVSTNGGTYGVRRCSECEAYYQDIGYGWNFCPNCGTRMEGVKE